MTTKELEKLEHYKNLSHERSLENKRINKRKKEIEHSRDSWKTKALAEKKRADSLKEELKKIKDRLKIIVPEQQ